MATRLTVRRQAKLSVAQYENTDVHYEISEDRNESITESQQIADMTSRVESYLKDKIDEIELGKRDVKSKAKRFGC